MSVLTDSDDRIASSNKQGEDEPRARAVRDRDPRHRGRAGRHVRGLARDSHAADDDDDRVRLHGADDGLDGHA
jgi:hypothetical protein